MPSIDLIPPTSLLPFHTHATGPKQCSSILVQTISAPLQTVWALLSSFDKPDVYKPFVRSCQIIEGEADVVGCVRRVVVASGLPASVSTERLEILDEEKHVFSFSIVGGDHRLSNYKSITTLHSTDDDGTLVLESYVIDVPVGNTEEETSAFVDTIIRCNLQSLARVAEGINPRFAESQQQQRAVVNRENTMQPSPFPCRICGSTCATGKYVGDSRWVITCRTCAESAIIKQGG